LMMNSYKVQMLQFELVSILIRIPMRRATQGNSRRQEIQLRQEDKLIRMVNTQNVVDSRDISQF
jgi:hypothetical protein